MKNSIVTIKIKDFGNIDVELYPEVAPITVANFLKLVNENYYENSSFHRIIKGFMIQGGANLQKADSIKGEFASNGVENPLRHERGVISMARTMIKDSASSQFFIMHHDSPHLDGEYAAFGKVIEGLDVVDRIANEKTSFDDQPLNKVVIETIVIK